MDFLGFLPYSGQNVVLVGVQAALVALPAAGLPVFARRFAGRAWSLVLPLSIAIVVAVLAVLPGAASGLTWLSLVAVPLLAAAAVGWAMHGARPGRRRWRCPSSGWRSATRASGSARSRRCC